MKRLIIMLLFVSSVAFVSCTTPNYSAAREYPDNRYNGYYDPFFDGPGYYNHRFNDPFYNHNYRTYRRPYVRRRPPVIIRQSPVPPVKVKPINPRTDKWNPGTHKKRNS